MRILFGRRADARVLRPDGCQGQASSGRLDDLSFPSAFTKPMPESTTRKRKAGSRTADYDIVEHTKHVRTFCFLSARQTPLHVLPFTACRPATEFFQNIQTRSINYFICCLICFVPGAHTIFPGLLETQTSCGWLW